VSKEEARPAVGEISGTLSNGWALKMRLADQTSLTDCDNNQYKAMADDVCDLAAEGGLHGVQGI
jgi:hypothetical protein